MWFFTRSHSYMYNYGNTIIYKIQLDQQKKKKKTIFT